MQLYNAPIEPGFNEYSNSHIPMSGGQAVSQPMLGVMPCEYVDEPYIAKN